MSTVVAVLKFALEKFETDQFEKEELEKEELVLAQHQCTLKHQRPWNCRGLSAQLYKDIHYCSYSLTSQLFFLNPRATDGCRPTVCNAARAESCQQRRIVAAAHIAAVTASSLARCQAGNSLFLLLRPFLALH